MIRSGTKEQRKEVHAKALSPVARGRRHEPPAIEFLGVHLAFGRSKILKGLNFKVRQGEMKIILGGSGSGKSTILKLTLGLLKPDRGQILIDGKDITAYSERRLMRVRERIGMVFQEGALFDSLTVYDNVAFRLHERGVKESVVEQEVRRMLRFVKLEKAINLMPNELSGGMKRRVGLARALAGNPAIILFDEPTAGLDPPTSHMISRLAMSLRDLDRVSSIYVTHRINLVKYLCSGRVERDDAGQPRIRKKAEESSLSNTTIFMLHEGKAIFDGTYESLSRERDPYIRKFLRGR